MGLSLFMYDWALTKIPYICTKMHTNNKAVQLLNYQYHEEVSLIQLRINTSIRGFSVSLSFLELSVNSRWLFLKFKT